MPRTEASTACNTLGENNKLDCWRSKGVLEFLFRAPSEFDFLAEDLGFLESLIGLNRVGAKSVSGVFWLIVDHGVLVPIEDGVFRVRELSIPSTASGVGRMA